MDEFDDEGMLGMEDLAGLMDEDLYEYLQNGGELTPELIEMIQAYGSNNAKPPVESVRIPLSEVLDNCIIPSSTQAMHTLMPLFILCLVFRLVCQLSAVGPKDSFIFHSFVHMSSAAFGFLVLHSFFKVSLIYPVLCCIICYLLLFGVSRHASRFCGVVMAAFIVLFTVSCELYFVDSKAWHSVRGAQIILSMKIISLGSDMASGRVASLPNPLEYIGYCLNVGSVIFGPWNSYKDYMNLLADESFSIISMRWLCQVILKTLMAGVCLLYSNCGTHWLITDGAWIWLLAYRDAQSFRFSHYFISFLSDATATLTGLTKQESIWNGSVSRPQSIEVPRSLVEVVTNWNLPMHYWLKTYVFKPLLPYGAFFAVIVTYATSSLLHGLNFQLSAVLLSLGFYSYTEYVFRRRLSQIFDACIGARRCKEKCDHKYQEKHPMVLLANGLFIGLAVVHLAYLGLMFDSSDGQDKGYTMWHTLDKWASLGYRSHLIALSTFVFYWLI